MRRTIPPVAGAMGGAGCPAGPKRAGSGGRPRRTGGRGGGDGGPRSSLDSLVSGAVANSSPDDDGDGEELGGAGGGGGRAHCAALERVLVIISVIYVVFIFSNVPLTAAAILTFCVGGILNVSHIAGNYYSHLHRYKMFIKAQKTLKTNL
jgi:hypothetical protein